MNAHQVHSLNHGIGFDTAAIELLLPTYGESLGLRGKICEHWALNPHPTMIPQSKVAGSKAFIVSAAKLEWINMSQRARISSLPDGMAACARTGFCVSLQDSMQLMALSVQRCRWMPMRTLPLSLLAEFPDSAVRQTWGTILMAGGTVHPRGLISLQESGPIVRGRKLVVQTVETFQKGGVPAFVETLDAVQVGKHAGMPIAPVMIYGDDVSHVVTEEGIAYLYKAEGQEERRRALAAVAGVSPVGLKAVPSETAALRKKGVVAYPEDIGVHRLEAKRSLLAARSMEDLVAWSGGLYNPPARFRSW
jgi:malonate decarboxylase alpha subunit